MIFILVVIAILLLILVLANEDARNIFLAILGSAVILAIVGIILFGLFLLAVWLYSLFSSSSPNVSTPSIPTPSSVKSAVKHTLASPYAEILVGSIVVGFIVFVIVDQYRMRKKRKK
ncbi:MAG: hypothetical protein BWX92_03611 [Deltaproteobacteria bacterium ADurb.Bin135]|jgi:hypothetical protein|nr:MAG: hypothetical protein BWX92_03611 [Deltaproteobacteria bacterium ADurb.Bin135]